MDRTWTIHNRTLVGRTHGSWTVVSYESGTGRHSRVRVQCMCGRQKVCLVDNWNASKRCGYCRVSGHREPKPFVRMPPTVQVSHASNILRILSLVDGNQTVAAKELGMNRATLYEHVGKLGLRVPQASLWSRSERNPRHPRQKKRADVPDTAPKVRRVSSGRVRRSVPSTKRLDALIDELRRSPKEQDHWERSTTSRT